MQCIMIKVHPRERADHERFAFKLEACRLRMGQNNPYYVLEIFLLADAYAAAACNIAVKKTEIFCCQRNKIRVPFELFVPFVERVYKVQRERPCLLQFFYSPLHVLVRGHVEEAADRRVRSVHGLASYDC